MTESVLLLWVLIIFTVYTNIELIWLMIKSVLYHAMCLYTPKTRLRSRQDPQWFDPSIRHQSYYPAQEVQVSPLSFQVIKD
jgi:hypothetical protein